MTRKGVGIPGLLVLLAVAIAPATGLAQPGTLLKNVSFPVGAQGFGVSVGVDCTGKIYYTLNGTNKLFQMDVNGVLQNSVTITDSVSQQPLDIDEIAFDANRSAFWGVLHGSNPEAVYQIDPANGVATFAFTSQTISLGTFRDGLAYDGTDDTLWISGDVSTTIEHYKTDGTFLGSITPKDANGNNLGAISGVSAGVGDLLYLGRDGFTQIVQVKKSDASFIGQFASPGGQRDEGLECDPVNFAPKLALWSREFNSPGFVSATELEAGTCACGGGGGQKTCPLTQGYWKNHVSAWKTTSILFDGQTYTQQEMLDIFNTPPRGNATITLGQQLFAALLNIANGSNPAPINQALADAATVLTGKIPYAERTNTAAGQQMVATAATLDAYNNSEFTPDCGAR